MPESWNLRDLVTVKHSQAHASHMIQLHVALRFLQLKNLLYMYIVQHAFGSCTNSTILEEQ